MRILNVTEDIHVSDVGIRLSADIDSNEERTVADGQRILRGLDCLLWEGSKGKGDIVSERFFHDIFSDTKKVSVVKQENLHCSLSPFVAVNILERPDANFNSFQVLHSTSNPSSFLFSGIKIGFLLYFNRIFNLVSKVKASNYSIIVLIVETYRLEICCKLFFYLNIHYILQIKSNQLFLTEFHRQKGNTIIYIYIYIYMFVLLCCVCLCFK
jgi:hypothetical protein